MLHAQPKRLTMIFAEHRQMNERVNDGAQFIHQNLPPIHDGVQKLTEWLTTGMLSLFLNIKLSQSQVLISDFNL